MVLVAVAKAIIMMQLLVLLTGVMIMMMVLVGSMMVRVVAVAMTACTQNCNAGRRGQQALLVHWQLCKGVRTQHSSNR